MQHLKKMIDDCIKENDMIIMFIIDELDRCRPDYAISYLETVKHMFDIDGSVFLISADRAQIENSARAAFGQDLDFEEYYRKFVHRETSLPDIDEGECGCIATQEGESDEDVYARAKMPNEHAIGGYQPDLNQFLRGWGDFHSSDRNRFAEIRQKIDQIAKWK